MSTENEDTEVLSLSALRAAFARWEEQEGTDAEPAPPDSVSLSEETAHFSSRAVQRDANGNPLESTSFLSVFSGAAHAAAVDFPDDFDSESPDDVSDPESLKSDCETENVSLDEDCEEETESVDTSPGRDDPVLLVPETILEAMLFVGDRENRPLTALKASELMRNVAPGEIDEWVERLNARYLQAGRPYRIVADRDGYRLVLLPEADAIRAKFYGRAREARLSQQAIDVLALVAYRQPITTEEVQLIRKQPSGAILTQLVRRGLLGIERNTEAKRPVLYYRTTPRFLELFGLESLDDLPTPEEIDYR